MGEIEMGNQSDGGGHFDEERLELYSLGSSDEEESALIEEHLLWCGPCASKLEEIDRCTRAMRTAATRIREEDRQTAQTPPRWEWLTVWLRHPVPAWGASILVAAGLIVGVGVMQRPQKPGAPVDVTLEALRGEEPGFAQAGHALNLHLDDRGLPETHEYRLEIVDEVGSRVWDGTGTWVGDYLLASVAKSFRPGTYFVRVVKEGSEPLREYKLTVQSSQ